MSVKNGKNKLCKICGRSFYVSKSRLKARFCSYPCDYKDRKRRVLGNKNPFFNKKHSNKTKQKLRLSHKRRGNNGRIIHPEGYVRILNSNHHRSDSKGYVLEHILVMEKHLGRRLKNGEVVHHINKIKSDNRINNLMLFPNNSAHLRFHRLSKDFKGHPVH